MYVWSVLCVLVLVMCCVGVCVRVCAFVFVYMCVHLMCVCVDVCLSVCIVFVCVTGDRVCWHKLQFIDLHVGCRLPGNVCSMSVWMWEDAPDACSLTR